MRIISVTNQKGGVGKTTVAMNVAALLAVAFKLRVLVVDVDAPQHSADKWAEQADACGRELPFTVAAESDPRVLGRLREHPGIDAIIVDTPGHLQQLDVMQTVLDLADIAILPVQPEPLALLALIDTIPAVIEPSAVAFRVLVTMANPLTRGRDVADANGFLDHHEIARFETAVRRYDVHASAPLDGRVVTDYASGADTRAYEDFHAVTAELHRQITATRSTRHGTEQPHEPHRQSEPRHDQGDEPEGTRDLTGRTGPANDGSTAGDGQ